MSRAPRPAGSRIDDRPVPELPPGGGLLLVDKPSGCTSHDVVGRLRRVLGTRRIGHAGTLDPMATGLLVLAVDRSTRLLGHLALTDKTYLATIRLGQRTDTDDADGLVVATAGSVDAVGDDDIRGGVASLTGPLLQVPSSVSAIRVDGRRAYDRVRAGETVELAARPVTVSRFEVVRPPRRAGGVIDLDVAVECTTGTYVRSLARDLGATLGVGGHLTRLRRTRVGPFDVHGSVDVFGVAENVDGSTDSGVPEQTVGMAADDIRPGVDADDGVSNDAPPVHETALVIPTLRLGPPRPPVTESFAAAVAAAIIPAAAAVREAFPARTVDAAQALDLRHGRTIVGAGIAGTYGAFDQDGALIALVVDHAGTARSVLGWQVAG